MVIIAREELNALHSEVIAVPYRCPTEVVILRRAGKDKLPMISIPHGGPHVSYTSEFDPVSICFASEGCKTFCVSMNIEHSFLNNLFFFKKKKQIMSI